MVCMLLMLVVVSCQETEQAGQNVDIEKERIGKKWAIIWGLYIIKEIFIYFIKFNNICIISLTEIYTKPQAMRILYLLYQPS